MPCSKQFYSLSFFNVIFAFGNKVVRTSRIPLYRPTIAPWINPYVPLLYNEQERVLCFQDWEADVERLRTLVQSRTRLMVELGSGSGAYLVEYSARHPDTVCFGIERRYKRAYNTVRRAKERGLDNLNVVFLDAALLTELFSPASISELVVNFPDPWPKTKQRKNRLINQSFLDVLASLLTKGGMFSFKSDHQEYFAEALELFRSDGRFGLEFVTTDLHNEIFERGSYQESVVVANIPTEFEMLFRSQGLPVCHLLARSSG